MHTALPDGLDFDACGSCGGTLFFVAETRHGVVVRCRKCLWDYTRRRGERVTGWLDVKLKRMVEGPGDYERR